MEKHVLTEEDRKLSEKEFTEKYNVSRATYYRALQVGHFVPGYHEKREHTKERERKSEQRKEQLTIRALKPNQNPYES